VFERYFVSDWWELQVLEILEVLKTLEILEVLEILQRVKSGGDRLPG
jgi:hypothetical protein